MSRPDAPAETVLQRYLGPEPQEDPREEEPSAALLSAFVAGDLPPGGARNSVARYLEARPELAAAILSALEFESAGDIEDAGDAKGLKDPKVLTLADLRKAGPISPLEFRATTTALAAADDEPPIPKDRQELISDQGLSLVCFRRLNEGWILLSGDAVRRGLVRLHTCSVGARACAISDEREGQIAKLGPLGALAEERLTIILETGKEELVASWDLRPRRHDDDVTTSESLR